MSGSTSKHVHDYVGQNEQHYEAVMNLRFAPTDADDDDKVNIYATDTKYIVTLDVAYLKHHVVDTSQSCDGVEANPLADMQQCLFRHIKDVNADFSRVTGVHKVVEASPPMINKDLAFLRFFWQCNFYKKTCPLRLAVTVPLDKISRFYGKTKTVEAQIILSGTQHVHYRHMLVSGTSDLQFQNVPKLQSRSVAMQDIRNSNVSNLSEIRDFNKRDIYKQRAKQKKNLQKSHLISESLHVSECQSMMEYNSTLLNFGVLPRWMQGPIHNSSVGRDVGTSVYSVKSSCDWLCFRVLYV